MRIYATFIAERYLALCEKKRQNVLKIKNFILLSQRILEKYVKTTVKKQKRFHNKQLSFSMSVNGEYTSNWI
jgi:hypothetical protein